MDDHQVFPPKPLLTEVSNRVGLIYRISFRWFSAAWASQNVKHPLTEIQQACLRSQVRGAIQSGCSHSLLHQLNLELTDFVRDTVIPAIQEEGNIDRLLELYAAFPAYMGDVLEWIQPILVDLDKRFVMLGRARPSVEINRTLNSFFCRQQKVCIINACFETVERMCSKYKHDLESLKHEGLETSPLATVVRMMSEHLPFGAFETRWLKPVFNEVSAQFHLVYDNMKEDIPENEFIIFSTKAIACTLKTFNVLCSEAEPWSSKMCSTLHDACAHFHAQKVNQGVYTHFASHLDTPAQFYEPTLVNDVAEMYYHSKRMNVLFSFDLQSTIPKAFAGWVQGPINTTFEERRNYPVIQLLEKKLMEYGSTISGNLLGAIGQTSVKNWLNETVQLGLRRNYFQYLTDRSMLDEIKEKEEQYYQFLIIPMKLKDFVDEDFARFSALKEFFGSMADQYGLSKRLETFLKEKIMIGHISDHMRIVTFLAAETVVSSLPKTTLRLIKDLRNSEDYFLSFKDSTLFSGCPLRSNSKIGPSALVLSSRGLPPFEENLLIRPASLAGLHEEFVEHVRPRLDPFEKLDGGNPCSFVTIKTSMFSGERDFVRIKLTVYQMAVLNVFQDMDSITMGDLYKRLIRPDIPEESRSCAEQVVFSVLKSMMDPAPLLLLFPKHDHISDSDKVWLNEKYSFATDFVQLRVPLLTKDIVGNTVGTDPQTRDRNAMKERIAAMMIKNRLKPNPLSEQHLLSIVAQAALTHNIEMEDIQFALSSMIEKSIVRRNESDSTLLELVAQEDEN